MNNQAKLIDIFSQSLGVDRTMITDNLQYNSIKQWDSVAHMVLIAQLEAAFDIMLDTDDIIAMSSLSKARKILQKYDIVF